METSSDGERGPMAPRHEGPIDRITRLERTLALALPVLVELGERASREGGYADDLLRDCVKELGWDLKGTA